MDFSTVLIAVLAILAIAPQPSYQQDSYISLGCWRDTSNRAIPTLEGDPILDGSSYQARENAIEKCARVAQQRGYTVFAVQHGGWCASSADALSTFDKYGRSTACGDDGEGGPWANNVYRLPVRDSYFSLGCWRDTSDRAIATLEGNPILDGSSYQARENAIEKCAIAAQKQGFSVFAVQNGGWCASSADALSTFDKYGQSTACGDDGEGGPWANNVYRLPARDSYFSLGCWRDTSNRAIATLEGNPILDGSRYQTRENAIEKCAIAAQKQGFSVFAVQNGGWCASSADALATFDKHGRSTACGDDGEGGPWANNVYRLPVRDSYFSLGCWRDTSDRAIATLEGNPILDGSRYQTRENAIEKCAIAAQKQGFSVFAVQNGGWCASSADALATFDKHGRSTACGDDGEGGPWANNVYRLPVRDSYFSLGCWGDTSNRAIATLEGNPILDGNSYQARKNAIEKCAIAAQKQGFSVFAVQHGGWCASSADALATFDKYGQSTACGDDGEGGPWANNVYRLPVRDSYISLGCWGDTSNRAIATLEGNPILDGNSYQTRENAIEKCAVAAQKQGFTVFAVQNGGWCASAANAEYTYKKYGRSEACGADGEGGPWANNVYEIDR